MKNYTGLVPRTPPEGLVARAAEVLDTHGLIYQAEWVEEEPLAPMLEERRPRKQKMVRVKCSACGGSTLLDWCQAGSKRTGYGFLHPGELHVDPWGSQQDYTPTVSGEATLCPLCGSPVEVRKAAEIGRGDFAPSEAMKMSAAVLEDGALVLTGWNIRLLVDREGNERVEARPYDAYVFTAKEAAKLTGWKKIYSGNAGYFRQYKHHWDQPQRWQEGWGLETEIFGLTPELVERSQLPNCKLYEYMHGGYLRWKYPVAYLRLYQHRPNVEQLVISGLPQVLDGLMAEEVGRSGWEKNRRGLPVLEEIDWEERRPSRMLGLTRAELRTAQSMGWDLFHWRLYRAAMEQGETLTEEDLRNAHYLGDERAVDLAGQGPVGRSLAYLLRQIEVVGGDPEIDAYVDPGDFVGVDMLLDYWEMSRRCGYDLTDPHIRWPRNLCAAHDERTAEAARLREKGMKREFRRRAAELAPYAFQAGALLIRPCRSREELNREGKRLCHCVSTYAESHASGETAIFFIRRADRPDEPYYTLEFDVKGEKVRQNRGKGNCPRTEEVTAFEALWLKWVRQGRPCRPDGTPVLPAGTRTGAA